MQPGWFSSQYRPYSAPQIKERCQELRALKNRMSVNRTVTQNVIIARRVRTGCVTGIVQLHAQAQRVYQQPSLAHLSRVLQQPNKRRSYSIEMALSFYIVTQEE
jgi:hypothetical protein